MTHAQYLTTAADTGTTDNSLQALIRPSGSIHYDVSAMPMVDRFLDHLLHASKILHHHSKMRGTASSRRRDPVVLSFSMTHTNVTVYVTHVISLVPISSYILSKQDGSGNLPDPVVSPLPPRNRAEDRDSSASSPARTTRFSQGLQRRLSSTMDSP